MLLRLSAVVLLCLASLSVRAEVSLLTSIKPLQLIAAAVQDGVGTPDVLLPAGASAHHYMLKPSEVRRLRQAGLFYWVGADLETFLPRVLDGRSEPSLAVQTLPGLQLRHFGDEHAGHDHDDEHEGHDDHEDEAAHDDHDDEHRPGSLDAHLWLLPANARLIAARMADDLAAHDPANAARYRTNLAAFEQRLDVLDQRLRTRLAPLAGQPYFVFHEAYDYFEEAYGLRHAGVFSIGEMQPGARQVAELRERLRAAGPTCVFYEPPQAPRLAQTLIDGLPVRLAALDALGYDLPVDGRAYERLLETLGEQLADCLTPAAR
ncbi:MAG TPA: zinc ABC transporter substrate-binding protein [Pseudomonas sp.]|nr:zinc ABC transporter substrate-binding protein [Pseudomonas sp.]